MTTPPVLPAPPAAGPVADALATPCPRCGTVLAPEQDWCLRCGAPARTFMAPRPRWRPVVALAATLALLGLAGLVVGFVLLTRDPAPLTAPATTAPPAQGGPAAPVPAAPATPPAVAPAATTPPATTPPPVTVPPPGG